MKKLFLMLMIGLSVGNAHAQISAEQIKENAKKQYIESTTNAYKKMGMPVDSTVLTNGLAQIDKMYDSAMSSVKNQVTPPTVPQNTNTASLKANQCLLSDGTIYSVGCGLDKNNSKLGNISLPLNGQVSGTTLLFTKDLEDLRGVLLAVAAKWREWDQTAKNNGVDKLNKELPMKLPKSSATWVTSHFWCSKIEEQTLYYILSNGKSTVSIVGAYRASLNNLITNNATYTWHSPEDIEKVAEIVDVNNLTSFLIKKSSVNDLFK